MVDHFLNINTQGDSIKILLIAIDLSRGTAFDFSRGTAFDLLIFFNNMGTIDLFRF